MEVLGRGEEFKVWGGTPGPEKKFMSPVRGWQEEAAAVIKIVCRDSVR